MNESVKFTTSTGGGEPVEVWLDELSQDPGAEPTTTIIRLGDREPCTVESDRGASHREAVVRATYALLGGDHVFTEGESAIDRLLDGIAGRAVEETVSPDAAGDTREELWDAEAALVFYLLDVLRAFGERDELDAVWARLQALLERAQSTESAGDLGRLAGPVNRRVSVLQGEPGSSDAAHARPFLLELGCTRAEVGARLGRRVHRDRTTETRRPDHG